MKTSKTLAILLILLLLLGSIPYSVLGAGTVTNFELQPNNQTVAYNDTFYINIYVTPNGTIDTCAVDNLTFTSNVLAVQSITQGDLFGGTTMWIPYIEINNNSGYVKGILWTWTGQTNAPGVFCNITFKAINPGVGYINLTDYGVALAGIPYTCNITSNATVTVEGLSVMVNSATSITNDSALLNGYLTSDNGELATCGFIYDNNISHPNATGYSFNVTCAGTYNEGDSFSKIVSLNCSTLYYYRAWAIDSFLFVYSSETFFRTPPGPPTNYKGNLTNTTGLQKDDLNISWNKGCGANRTIVRSSTTSYLSSPTDGTEVYNDTGTWVIEENLTEPHYYTLWSYSNVSGIWMFSDPVNLSWGGLFVNVFNESSFNNISFDISITNQLGTEYYNQSDCVNTLVIPVNLCPNGEQISIQISNTSYKTRYYYMDIFENYWYSLNAYLPPENVALLYLITVINPYEFPVEDAYVQFKTYSPIIEMYESVSNLYTDANGQINLYLLPDTVYKVVISKTGYETEIADYIPDTEIRIHTFRLEFEIIDPSVYDQLFDNIDYNIDPEQRYHTNGFTIYYNITSSNNKLQWYRMNVYWYNESDTSWVLLSTQNVSGSGGGSLSYVVSNITGRYHGCCYFKKEGFNEYEVVHEGSIVWFISWGGLGTNPAFDLIPDWIYLLIIVIIMILVMAVLMPYAGLATGYIGIGIFGFALALKDFEVTISPAGDAISGWFILLLTALIYTAAIFLWSRI